MRTCPLSALPLVSVTSSLWGLLFCLLGISTPAAAQNSALVFDSSVDGYVEIPFAAQLVPQSGITVEAWITYDDATLPTGWRFPTIVRQGIGAGGENIMLRIDADNVGERELRWAVRTQGGATTTVNYQFQPGEFVPWTHVAGSYDGSELALYVNGMQVASQVGNGLPLEASPDVFRIGKGSDVATPIEVFHGSIDEVRLWPFARTAEDIQQSMNLELMAVPGFVSTWNFNGDYTDSSAQQNATAGGLVVFTNSAPSLAPFAGTFPLGLQQGSSSPGCSGELRLTPSGPSVENYADYRVVATQTEANAPVFWAASGGVLSVPLQLLGVDVWLDPTAPVLVGGTADGLGTASVSLPIPVGVAGFTFAIQCLALDSCGPQSLAASDALLLFVQ
ncbi:MAG: LamG domain-containing protein [Planctomycetota bacterium]